MASPAAIGWGPTLWRVEVIVRGSTDRTQQLKIEAFIGQQLPSAVDRTSRDYTTEVHSYSHPPSGEMTSVVLWVDNKIVGDAAGASTRLVLDSYQAVVGRTTLWEVKLVPNEAITSREDFEVLGGASLLTSRHPRAWQLWRRRYGRRP